MTSSPRWERVSESVMEIASKTKAFRVMGWSVELTLCGEVTADLARTTMAIYCVMAEWVNLGQNYRWEARPQPNIDGVRKTTCVVLSNGIKLSAESPFVHRDSVGRKSTWFSQQDGYYNSSRAVKKLTKLKRSPWLFWWATKLQVHVEDKYMQKVEAIVIMHTDRF